jgi:membrane protein involved in colicin uptake
VKDGLNLNLNETIITSLFFHLILFALLLAGSAYTTRISGDMPNIISVDLMMQNSAIAPAPPSRTADKPSPAAAPPAPRQMTLPEQATGNLPEEAIPEEAANTTQPEEKAEPAPAPVKAEAPPREKFTSLEGYLQFVMIHKKIFSQQARRGVNELLDRAFKVNKRVFYGGTAAVSLQFGPDGRLTGVLVDSTTPELKAFLEEIDWNTIPPPAAYSLRSGLVRIEFAVHEGYMSFNVNTL